MSRLLRANRSEILAGLTLAALGLGVANLVKGGVITESVLEQKKDAIEALAAVVTTALVFLGAIFSYFRFFRGRTLAVRAEISIEVSVHGTPRGSNLHAVRVLIKNVGASAIWEPRPELRITFHGCDAREVEVVTNWSDLPGCGDPSLVPVIDTGESISYFCHREVPGEIWAVTYEVAVRAASGDIWQSGRTVSNIPEATAEMSPNPRIAADGLRRR